MATAGVVLIVVALIAIALLLVMLFSTMYRVEQQSVAIIERNGRFHVTSQPGLHFKLPLVDRVAEIMDLRSDTLPVELEALTKDNVTVHLAIAVQYRVIPDQVYDAYYQMENPDDQMRQLAENAARAEINKHNLVDAIGQVDAISNAVKTHVGPSMAANGFEIIRVPVTQISPDPKVADSLNSITAAQNYRQAEISKAEGDRQAKILNAEADRQAKILAGQGVAGEREAIIEGLQKTIDAFRTGSGVSSQEAIMMILVTQHFDALRSIAQTSNTNTLFVNNAPGAVGGIVEELMAVLRSTFPEPALQQELGSHTLTTVEPVDASEQKRAS